MIQVSNQGGLVGIFADQEDLYDFLTKEKEGSAVSLVGLGWIPYTKAPDEFLEVVEESRIQGRAEGRYRKGALHFSPSSHKAIKARLRKEQQERATRLTEAEEAAEAASEAQASAKSVENLQAEDKTIFVEEVSANESDPNDTYKGLTPREKAAAKAVEIAESQQKPKTKKKRGVGGDGEDILLAISEASDDAALKAIALKYSKGDLAKAAGEPANTKLNRLALVKAMKNG